MMVESNFTFPGHGASNTPGRIGPPGEARPGHVQDGVRHHEHRRTRALEHGQEALPGRPQEGHQPATVQILKGRAQQQARHTMIHLDDTNC